MLCFPKVARRAASWVAGGGGMDWEPRRGDTGYGFERGRDESRRRDDVRSASYDQQGRERSPDCGGRRSPYTDAGASDQWRALSCQSCGGPGYIAASPAATEQHAVGGMSSALAVSQPALMPSSAGGGAAPAPASSVILDKEDDPQIPVHRLLEQLDQQPFDAALPWDEGRGSEEDVAGELGRILGKGVVRYLTLGGSDAHGFKRLGAVPAKQHERWPMIALAPLRRPDARSMLSLCLTGLPLFGNDALSPLSELCALRSLRVEHSPSLPTSALSKLIKLIRLELVSFCGCASVGDQAPGMLLSSQRLKALHLDGTSAGDIALLTATIFPALARLHFSCTAASDIGVTLLSKRAPALTDVSAAGCAAVTDVGLLNLAVLPKLRRVDMSGCARVSPSALELFAAKRPGCSLGPANGLAAAARVGTPPPPIRNVANGSARLAEFMGGSADAAGRREGGPGRSYGGGGVVGAGAHPRQRPADARPPPHHSARSRSLQEPGAWPGWAPAPSSVDPRLAKDPRTLHHPPSQPHGLSQDTLAAVAALRPQHRHH
jgi:hypothetical protein